MKDTKNLDLILSKLSKEDKEQILSLVAQKDSEIQEWKQRAMHLEELLNARRKEKFCISSEQLSLFEQESPVKREKDEKLEKAIDALRHKYGSDSIQRGTVMNSGIRVAGKFKGRQEAEKEN